MDPITNEEDVSYHLGRFYFQNGEYKKAIKIYKSGLAVNNQSIILLYEIGAAYLKLKNRKKAWEYWRRLVKIAPFSICAVEVRDKISAEKNMFKGFL